MRFLRANDENIGAAYDVLVAMRDETAMIEERLQLGAFRARKRGFAPFIPVVNSLRLLHLAERLRLFVHGAKPPLFVNIPTALGVIRVYESDELDEYEILLLAEHPEVTMSSEHDGIYERLIQAAEALMDVATRFKP